MGYYFLVVGIIEELSHWPCHLQIQTWYGAVTHKHLENYCPLASAKELTVHGSLQNQVTPVRGTLKNNFLKLKKYIAWGFDDSKMVFSSQKAQNGGGVWHQWAPLCDLQPRES